ncbi:hypothetical protein OV208_01890 [Corallococcus sp. bb12-1]|uniref:hypothetical protein n=1 Tax=Corallococcus sp. bb12-1 TaxID=2996784 RepID=UPI00226FB852|nr:hypothetical protein [Corallococcus sp. bb12-1]MCY1040055.1 hypothetical protein [Corallococcus sp. bb12-1]
MAFNPERLLNRRVYLFQGPLQELLRDLEGLKNLGQIHRVRSYAHRVRGRWLLLGCVSLAFLLSYLSPRSELLAEHVRDDVPILLGVLGFTLWILQSLRGFLLLLYKDILQERRSDLALVLIHRLQVDLEPGALVGLRLVLDASDLEVKRVRERPQGRWTVKDYVDPWLAFQGRLRDGTRLRLTAVERVRTLFRWKESKNGLKLKPRTRVRSCSTRLRVMLRVKPKRYLGLKPLEDAVRLPPDVTLERLRISQDRLDLRVVMEGEHWVARAPPEGTPAPAPRGMSWPPRETTGPRTNASRVVTMLLLSLYQTLGATRAREKARRARRGSLAV